MQGFGLTRLTSKKLVPRFYLGMQYRGSSSGIQLEVEPLKPAFQGWSLGTRKETIGWSLGAKNAIITND
jgi:hypothetical protein